MATLQRARAAAEAHEDSYWCCDDDVRGESVHQRRIRRQQEEVVVLRVVWPVDCLGQPAVDGVAEQVGDLALLAL